MRILVVDDDAAVRESLPARCGGTDQRRSSPGASGFVLRGAGADLTDVRVEDVAGSGILTLHALLFRLAVHALHPYSSEQSMRGLERAARLVTSL